jgi:hypothetical protein
MASESGWRDSTMTVLLDVVDDIFNPVFFEHHCLKTMRL